MNGWSIVDRVILLLTVTLCATTLILAVAVAFR